MNNNYLRLLYVTFALSSLSSMSVMAQDKPGNVTNTYALENVHVVTRPGITIQNANVIIKDGLIHNLGKGIPIPANAKRIKCDTMYVYAGFIDGLSHIGVPKLKKEEPKKENNKKQDPGNPTNERAGITPDRNVQDYLSPKDKSISDFRKVGYTAVHAVPRGKMLPGSGSVILLNEGKKKDLVYNSKMSTFGQLKGAGGVFPNTIIAVMTKWREMYYQARQASTHISSYHSSATGKKRPAYDEATLAMIPVTKKQSQVFMYTEKHLDIHRAMVLQKDLGFRMTLAGLQNGWRLADQIKSRNIPVLLSLDLPKEPKKEKKKDDAKTKTMWDEERDALLERQKEEINQRVNQAATFEQKGIPFGFTTEGTTAKNVKANIIRMISAGLSEKAALAALTTHPASILGVQRSMGTVEKGKIANLVISDKPLFDEKSEIRYVFVDGNLHKYEAKSKKAKKKSGEVSEEFKDIVGTWSYTIDADGMIMKGELEITEEDGNLAGTLTGDQMEEAAEIDELLLTGTDLTFNVEIDGQFEIDWNTSIDDDTMTGEVKAGDFGTFPITGTRTSGPE